MPDDEYLKLIETPVFENYELVGTVSCGVWRWEATDENTLGKEGLKKLKKDKKEFCMDIVKLDVAHGVWEWQHWFNQCNNDYPPEFELPEKYVYSKFTLKEI